MPGPYRWSVAMEGEVNVDLIVLSIEISARFRLQVGVHRVKH